MFMIAKTELSIGVTPFTGRDQFCVATDSVELLWACKTREEAVAKLAKFARRLVAKQSEMYPVTYCADEVVDVDAHTQFYKIMDSIYGTISYRITEIKL